MPDYYPEKVSVPHRKDSPTILFLGSGVGVYTLETLLEKGVDVGKVLSDKNDPVIKFARTNDIPFEVLTDKKSLDKSLADSGLEMGIKYMVVAFTDHVIPKNFTEKYFAKIIGVHASNLPLYRGGYPIEAALLDGKKGTSIVTYLINEGLDKGAVLRKASFSLTLPKIYVIDGNYIQHLYENAAIKAGELLAKTLFDYERINPREQKRSEATYSHKPKKEDLTIDWQNHTREHVINMMKAGGMVYTKYMGHDIIICGLELVEAKVRETSPGSITIITPDKDKERKICITTKDGGVLGLNEVKFAEKQLQIINLNGYIHNNYLLEQKLKLG